MEAYLSTLLNRYLHKINNNSDCEVIDLETDGFIFQNLWGDIVRSTGQKI